MLKHSRDKHDRCEGRICTKECAASGPDETQVYVYAKTTQCFNTGNVATVTREDMEKQPVVNPLLALEGRVPGLNIYSV